MNSANKANSDIRVEEKREKDKEPDRQRCLDGIRDCAGVVTHAFERKYPRTLCVLVTEIGAQVGMRVHRQIGQATVA